MPFDDASVDLVFSYNAFERFAEPDAVLREMLRVVRPGGIAYFNFGPLYRSAYGPHSMMSVTVPFCHHLFEREVLDDYVSREGLRPIPWATLNEWRLQSFRDLWTSVRAAAPPQLYREVPESRGLRLIEHYPSCFQSRTNDFDDLMIGMVEVALRRTEEPLPRLE